MVGENLGIHMSQMAKNEQKYSTMVGENFEIYMSQMAKNEQTLTKIYKISRQYQEIKTTFAISRQYQENQENQDQWTPCCTSIIIKSRLQMDRQAVLGRKHLHFCFLQNINHHQVQ